ncbi:hypothetical protein ACIBIZ_22740 [Nonomuraea spiralis]|uniref:hypothetical protein n=1 Tax=Nonomuraea TaxID=83681 RepID=UPI000F7B9FC8|nr:hypothetical protein [Nonomuraea sp. WAC 01424]RSN06713.1 hypothetical protein DMB42_26000 [Nonomuraea sp. WAC 01424]
MDFARGDGTDLELTVRQELTDAGFNVEPSVLPIDGGLGVRLDPARGVVVAWSWAGGETAGHLVEVETIRTVVLLALRTVLARAGHQIREGQAGLELVVTS